MQVPAHRIVEEVVTVQIHTPPLAAGLRWPLDPAKLSSLPERTPAVLQSQAELRGGKCGVSKVLCSLWRQPIKACRHLVRRHVELEQHIRPEEKDSIG